MAVTERCGGASREHHAKTLDRKGLSVGFVAAANFVIRAPAPTSVNIALATGAHQPEEVGRPRSGRVDQGSGGPLGPRGRDQPNILSLDLNFYF